MATDMITLKLDDKFLKEIDDVVKEKNYQNRTEFIREALREKVDEVKMKQAMMEIAHLKGAGKGKSKITDEEWEKAREDAFDELYKSLK